MCIVSYVSFNGRLAQQAIDLAIETSKPLILVYEHSHKARVMLHLRDSGLHPLALVDDRWKNLQHSLAAGFRAVHCLTGIESPTTIAEEENLSRDAGINLIKTQEELVALFH